MRTALIICSSILGSLLIGGFVAYETGAWDHSSTVVNQRVITQGRAVVNSDGSFDPGAIYRRYSPGVAFITTKIGGTAATPASTGEGSGFVIDKSGYILTNEHVVDGQQGVQVVLGKKSFQANVVGQDASTDLALLKINPGTTPLVPLQLGNSSSAVVGDSVMAIGNPYGLERTLTTGIVSALQRDIQSPNGFNIAGAIQTDAAINPGNSGGPMLDASGKVIGINSQILTGGSTTKGNIGIGFAVPINLAKGLLTQLKQGNIERAYLGVLGVNIDPKLVRLDAKLPKQGVLIQETAPNSPAAKAGLQGGKQQAADANGAPVLLGGDAITKVNGKPITSMQAVIKAVSALKPGDKLTVTYVRSGQTLTTTVTLGVRPNTKTITEPRTGQ